MATPDAPSTPKTDRERILLLQNDVEWVKKNTTETIQKINQSLDQQSEQMNAMMDMVRSLPGSLKSEIKADLSEEFERRFVPKRALYVGLTLAAVGGFASGGMVGGLFNLVKLAGLG